MSDTNPSWPPPVSGQYIPPGQDPRTAGPVGGGPARPTGGTGTIGGLSRRHALWLVAIVAVVAVLLSSHRISSASLIVFLVIIPSIMLHEVAHGWVALAFGDDTAKRAGRLTFNPIAHIDVVGTLIVPAIMILGGFGFFGWAKPVPVNPSRLRSPRNQGVLVALAGPATNLVLVAVSALLFRLYRVPPDITLGATPLWVQIVFYLGLANLLLAIFNLLPIPPLDGSVVIERALPRHLWSGYLRFRQFAMPLLLVAVLLAATVHVGGESLLTRLYDNIEDLWLDLLGVGS
jgi:Zn-dependent protease